MKGGIKILLPAAVGIIIVGIVLCYINNWFGGIGFWGLLVYIGR